MDSKKRQNTVQLQAVTVTSYWLTAKQRHNAVTHFECSKQSEIVVTGVIGFSGVFWSYGWNDPLFSRKNNEIDSR